MPIITDFQLSIKAEDILEGQGIAPERAKPALVAGAEEVIEETLSLVRPAAIYDFVPVRDFHHKTIELDGGVSFEGPFVAQALAGAEEVALVVCTIGPRLEERMKELFASDPVRAVALDGAGIAALRQVSDAIITRIRKEGTARELGTGMRAQPGQEGWPIQQQRMLFNLIPADEIDVRLSESYLMLPHKSVSFVIGIGPDMRPDAVACDFCSKRNRCPWRIKQ